MQSYMPSTAEDIKGQRVTIVSDGELYRGVVTAALDDPDGGIPTVVRINLATSSGAIALQINPSRGDWFDVGIASDHLTEPRQFIRSPCGVQGTLLRMLVRVDERRNRHRFATILQDDGAAVTVGLAPSQQLLKVLNRTFRH